MGNVRRPLILQQFKVGERLVNKKEAMVGRRVVRTVRKICHNGRIKFKRDEREYHPNHFERV